MCLSSALPAVKPPHRAGLLDFETAEAMPRPDALECLIDSQRFDPGFPSDQQEGNHSQGNGDAPLAAQLHSVDFG